MLGPETGTCWGYGALSGEGDPAGNRKGLPQTGKLIDMDRVSRGHPVIEISDLNYFYVVLGEDDPAVVEKHGPLYERHRRAGR